MNDVKCQWRFMNGPLEEMPAKRDYQSWLHSVKGRCPLIERVLWRVFNWIEGGESRYDIRCIR